MNITIIGASGFVGTRLMSLLDEDGGYKLKNIDLQPSHFFNHYTTIGDVRIQQQMDTELSGADVVVLLAAQHRDDVTPTSLYYDTNVEGMRVTLRAMEKNNIKRLVFFSSVAVYGLNKVNPDESHPKDPFNHYGKSKWQAEQVIEEWQKTHPDWNVNIIRPTVIFGERNRGNVYNLLHQIAGGKFIMVGSGRNTKSMAYVGNVVAFVKYILDNITEGYNVYNYVDKPDFTMNELVCLSHTVLNKKAQSHQGATSRLSSILSRTHFPYWLGMMGGYAFDAIAFVMGKKLSISSVRVKKFCATTQFDATKAHSTGFKAPYTLAEGLSRTISYEFVTPPKDDVIFLSE